MATITQTIPIPPIVFSILQDADIVNNPIETAFGTMPTGEHVQAFRKITNVSNNPSETSDVGTINFGSINLVDGTITNVNGPVSSMIKRRVMSAFSEFKIHFTLPLQLDIPASHYTYDNNDIQRSVFRGACTIKWATHSGRVIGNSRLFSLGSGSIACTVISTISFKVSTERIGIFTLITPELRSINDFTRIFTDINISCDSVNPIRRTEPARFELNYAKLNVTYNISG